jgi:hypothetical protein
MACWMKRNELTFLISQRVPRLKSPVSPGRRHRDVDVGPQVALLHVAVAGAEIDEDRAQLLHIGRGFFGRAHVRLGDDLHQRRARAVEVDVGGVGVEVVQDLPASCSRCSRSMRTVKVEPSPARRHLALADDRVLELADLIALRQVGIEVVLAVEARPQIDLRLEAQAGAHGLLDAMAC